MAGVYSTGNGCVRIGNVAECGLTLAELLRRSREAAGVKDGAIGDPAVLRLVLNDEVRRGRVDYHSTSRRYRLNGGLPDDVKAALREL